MGWTTIITIHKLGYLFVLCMIYLLFTVFETHLSLIILMSMIGNYKNSKGKNKIYEQLKDHSKADEAFFMSSSYILELAHNGYSLFKSSQTSKKREILNFVFANFEADGSKLLYKTKEPFGELLFCAESWKWLPKLDSNQWPTG